jgi:GT2 family glycosyltransferase
MKLHIVTAITRPENVRAIELSFAPAAAAGVDVVWHTQADPERAHVGGQGIKNQLLDQITDGWVWICDDDNVAHADFFRALAQAAQQHPDARLLVIAQQHRSGGIRQVHRQMLKQTHVDAAQVVARRDAIGELRIPEHYCGDGEWIEALANTLAPEQIVYIREPLVFYNWLRGPQPLPLAAGQLVLGIPTMTRFDLLDTCIASALAGTVAPDRVIVVDNSAGQCPRRSDVTYLVPNRNLGVAAAWNLIARHAGQADLIVSNDDIVFANDTIQAMLDVAHAHERAGIVSPIEGQRFCLFYLRRAAYLDVGPFDETFWPAYFEDNDYHRRLTLNGWESPVAPSGVQHAHSATVKEASAADLELHHARFRANARRYALKHGGMPGQETRP